MKKILCILLVLALLLLPALAESAAVFAPDGAGIALSMGDWVQQLGNHLYYTLSRDTDAPCEYSALLFSCEDDSADGMTPAFALCNRLKGSEYVPDEALHLSQVLSETENREMVLFYTEPAADDSDLVTQAMTLPAEWLLSHPEDVVLSEPVPQAAAVGLDALYGLSVADETPVHSDVLSGSKLTMLNVWATYCNPCISEMPELAKLNADYAEQGFQIIGIVSDAGSAEMPDASAMEYARLIVEKTGADYLHILPGEGMMYGALASVTAVPTTYFVNERGETVSEPYVGSRSYAEWAAIIETLLENAE